MNINGKCYIAKKYQSQEKDFTNYGNVASGMLCWQNKIKTKTGESKTYTYKRFTAFKENIEIIENNLDKMLVIEGYLRTEKFTDKEGKERNVEKIIINKAIVYEKGQSEQESIGQIKENLQISDEDLNDDIPF